MKTKIYNVLLIILIISILWCQQSVTVEIRKAVLLFQKNIFPSLFPFMVLSPFFIRYGFFDFIRKYLGPLVKKIFRISESSAYLFFMSIISGFPSSATCAKNLYEESCITQKEAFHTLLFSHFSNPIFIFSMVTVNPGLVLFSHYISNVIIGLILRFQQTEKSFSSSKKLEIHTSFFEVFTSSIKNAMQNSLFILGVVVFFFMLNSIFDFSFTHLLLELSQGLSYVNTFSLTAKQIACVSAFLLSFGGFSVHIQTYGILSEWNLPYLPYFFVRLIHGILSSALVFFLY